MNKRTLPYIYFTAFIAALSLLVFTTVTGARALPSQQSEVQTTNMQMYSIGVTIQEGNEADDKWTDIASEPGATGTAFSAFSSAFEVGKYYSDDFRVKNSGNIDEYVRVVIYKYWVAESDSKAPVKDKDYKGDVDLIQLDIPENTGWMLDKNNSTDEKTILVYDSLLEANGGVSNVFMRGLMLDGKIKEDYTKTYEETYEEDGTKYTTVIYEYTYNGRMFKVQIEADAVQTHHAIEAIKSAWGLDMNESNNKLSFN